MKKRIAAGVGLAAVIVGGLLSPAGAHFRMHTDADDASGNLDAKRAWIERVDEHTTTVNVRTHERFGTRALMADDGSRPTWTAAATTATTSS